MKRGRRRRPTLPDGDDILAEILLRLPSRPSSLPRAGLVCKRWRRLVADPQFLRRFRAFHHRAPPIHGFFLSDGRFFPTQDPPDRVPPWRFSLDSLFRELHAGNRWSIHCCRHGLVLCGRADDDFAGGELMVVEPMTGDRSRVAITDEHKQDSLIAAAVVAAAGTAGGGGADDRRRPFVVVALFARRYDARLAASVYSSDSGAWSVSVSDLSTPSPALISIVKPNSLVGNAIYWFLLDGEVVRFDLKTQSLGIIEQPPVADDDVGGFMFWNDCRRWIVPAAGCDDRFCLVILSGLSIEFWEREAETELGGGGGWALSRSVELGKVLPMRLKERVQPLGIMGFAEESNVMFVFTLDGVFMGDVESMEFKKVFARPIICNVHPYSSF